MATPEGSQASVLIADDDPLVRRVLRYALESRGYRVTEALDVAEVISAAATCVPDLVVLDINMPGGTVHEAISALRARHPGVPILVLSGATATTVDIDSPVTDFAQKPIDLDDLVSRAERVLAAGPQA